MCLAQSFDGCDIGVILEQHARNTLHQYCQSQILGHRREWHTDTNAAFQSHAQFNAAERIKPQSR